MDFIADFASWKASTLPVFLDTARNLTRAAQDALLGDTGVPPLVVDPFAGGGAIPLEALRIGAATFASDINPVAVILLKTVLDAAPALGENLRAEYQRSASIIEDRAAEELRGLFPQKEALWQPQVYFWARTVACTGPGCGAVVPMLRSLRLGAKRRPEYALSLDVREGTVTPRVMEVSTTTKVAGGTIRGASCTCPVCGHTMKTEAIRSQLMDQYGGANNALLVAVLEKNTETNSRRFRNPEEIDLCAYRMSHSLLEELTDITHAIGAVIPTTEPRRVSVPSFGMRTFSDLFNARQLAAAAVYARHIRAYFNDSTVEEKLRTGVSVLLCCALNKMVDYNCSLSMWMSSSESLGHLFGRQAIGMVWDYAETNLAVDAFVGWNRCVSHIDQVIDNLGKSRLVSGSVLLSTAVSSPLADDCCDLFFTDPPYYDSVPYAHLSDFFYVWFRAVLGDGFDGLLSEDVVAKDEELVVDRPHKSVRSVKGPQLYETRMTQALKEGRRITRPDGIGVVVFAHKSTAGWESLLSGLIDAGWIVTAAWSIDTESPTRTNARGTASLASSVHLICRPRENPDGSTAESVGDWRDVLADLPLRIHQWLPRLAAEGIVGADAIFACIGPALEAFSCHSRVERANGETVTLREYLEQVWAAVSKEALGMIFSEADATGFEEDARLTAMWLWTLSAGDGRQPDDQENGDDESVAEADGGSGARLGRYSLEYDAARKIAQGLGVHLERLGPLIEVKGDVARLLTVAERARALFGGGQTDGSPRGRKKREAQLTLDFRAEVEEAESTRSVDFGERTLLQVGSTSLDRLHQAMLLFGAGRNEALRRFLVEDGGGEDQRFWRLAQALSALYPSGTDEKRWVDGVMARKKSLGF